MAEVRLLCGARSSVRAAEIDAVFDAYWGRAVLLVPTHAYAQCRRDRLVAGSGKPGLWGAPVRQFTAFAQDLLEAEGVRVWRMDDFERRLMLESGLRRLHEAAPSLALPNAAELPGMVSHVLRIITQLKQAAIEPAEFRRRLEGGPGPTERDVLVAEAYTAYQDALKTADAYDVPGIYWQAESLCAEGRPAILDGVEAVLIDGFDDFTPSEFRLIEAIEKHVDHLCIGINHDERPDRQDLYTLPRTTAEILSSRLQVTATSRPASTPTRFSEYAADKVFWRDPPRLPKGLVPDIEVLPCADTTHEAESVARRIKRLVRDRGVPAERIAVVYRHIGEAASVVRDVFHEFGIPHRLRHAPSLDQSGIGAFMAGLAEVDGAWPRETTVEALTSPWFRPEGLSSEHLDALPMLARASGVIEGHGAWCEGLDVLRKRADRGDAALSCLPDAGAAVDELCQRAERLHTVLAAIPDTAAPAALAVAMDRLIEEAGVEAALSKLDDTSRIQEASSALGALRGLLHTLGQHGATECTKAEFWQLLEQGLRETTYASAVSHGGVLCGEAAYVRNLDFDYVFFCGLVEGTVPAPPPRNAVYTDADLQRLQQRGIPLEGKHEHSARERMLFHHVLTLAREHLVLTWPVTKGDHREATPSPFLTEVEALFDEEGTHVSAAPPRADDFVPSLEEAACPRDAANGVFYRHSKLAKVKDAPWRRILDGVAVEAAHQDTTPFGCYDGVLDDPAIHAVLGEKYGADHAFSAGALERYVNCPFQAFADGVLKITEAAEPDPGFDPRLRGSIAHRALHLFHARFEGQAVPEIPAKEAERALRAALDEAFGAVALRSGGTSKGLLEAEHGALEAKLLRYLIVERDPKRDKADWKPSRFELAFGVSSRGGEAADAFVLDTDAGRVRLSGRLDRVDLSGPQARVIDYKLSTIPKAGDITAGHALQLTLYAWALEGLLMPGVACAEAWYLRLGSEDRRNARGKGKKWEGAEENARDAVAKAVTGLRTGDFPPTPAGKGCAYCRHRGACRYDEARVERKQTETKKE